MTRVERLQPTIASPWARAAVACRHLVWPLWFALVLAWTLSRILIDLPPALAAADGPASHVAMLMYGAVGAFLVIRRPTNVVGWLFYAVGLFDTAASSIRGIAVTGLAAGAPRDSLAATAAWLQSWMWAPSLGALVLLVWLFPTGTRPPGRWRFGVYATVGLLVVLVVPTPVALWPHRGPALLEDVALPGAAAYLPLVPFSWMVLVLCWGVVWLGVRFRHSAGEERQQLKWFLYAAALTVAIAAVDVALEPLGVIEPVLSDALSALSLVLLPTAAAIAVLAYRLYDIDRVINRTLVYAALTSLLAGTYLAMVAAVRAMTVPLTGDSAIAVAASTLAVAALFGPARRRIQAGVDRRFNRARYDAALTVARFSGRLRDAVELDALETELLGVVGATMQPARATLWLREQLS